MTTRPPVISSTDTHLIKWDVRTIRDWHPVYLLSGSRYYSDPVPPCTVSISAEFDDNQAALEFERRVRDILEVMGAVL